MRKRDALPADSQWHDTKYDTFFVGTLMSDDEDELDSTGKRMGRFVSRGLLYRTQEVSY
jgi:hypothetical protein